MNSITLSKLLQRTVDPTKCALGGVLPKDMISVEEFTDYPTCIIANTDDSTRPGQHWVSYYFDSPTDYEFFDSFGYSPAIYEFAPCFSHPVSFNSLQVQPDFSTTCAHHCLNYLHKKSLGFTMSEIMSSFNHFNLVWNDRLVRKFVQSLENPVSFVQAPHIPCPVTQISIKLPRFIKRYL